MNNKKYGRFINSPQVKTITKNGFSWVNVSNAAPKEMDVLKKMFSFHDDDLKSCLPPTQRPQIVERKDYLFVIMLFPTYDRKTGTMHRAEIDLFIGNDFIVTVHQNELESIKSLFEECVVDRGKILENALNGEVIFQILDSLMYGIHAMLVHIGNDIDSVRENVVGGGNRKHLISEMLRIKTNMSTFHSTVQSHKRLVEKLTSYAGSRLNWNGLPLALQELKEDTKENWDLVENFKDSIDAIHDAFSSMVELRTSEIIKILTMLSMVMLPLSLVTTIFAMNLKGMPFRGPMDFWTVFGGMILIAVAIFLFYKSKKWI